MSNIVSLNQANNLSAEQQTIQSLAAVNQWFDKAFTAIAAKCSAAGATLSDPAMKAQIREDYLKAFASNGLGKSEVKIGIKALEQRVISREPYSQYLPSAGEFVALCAESTSYPSEASCFAEVAKNINTHDRQPWSCELVKRLAAKTGGHFRTITNQKQLKELFSYEYEATKKALEDGTEEPRKALPKQQALAPEMEYYNHLKQQFPDENHAEDYRGSLENQGVILNPETGEVNKPSSVVKF